MRSHQVRRHPLHGQGETEEPGPYEVLDITVPTRTLKSPVADQETPERNELNDWSDAEIDVLEP
jgi:hypothetical protein